jgi:DNA-binding winged helix-turn-helix (wHTH) protein/tetratricopeptide (TPR) repeat protein
MTLVFEQFVLDLAKRELRRGQTPVPMEPQAFDLLGHLIAHRHRVVGREELTEAIWHGRIVSDAALTTRISTIRRALGDTGKSQRLIRTVSRKGFRFVAAVQEIVDPNAYGQEIGRRSAVDLRSRRQPELASIGVFPFAALTEGAVEQRLGESLASELVIALCHYRWFSVLAPLSMLRSSAGLGNKLDFRYAVGGTVQRHGKILRIAAHLIDASSGRNLWGDRFDGRLGEGLTWQDGVVATMAGSIEPQIRMAEAYGAAQADRHATPYRLHLHAHPIFSDGRASVMRSLHLLERAVSLDPDYAPALADAAFCLQVLDINVGGRDRSADRRNAVGFARRALEIAKEPEPIATSAFALAYFGEDMDEALALLDHALTLNPYFARGWYMKGMAHLYAGEPEPALESLRTSLRLNPQEKLGHRNNFGIGLAEFFMGHHGAAIAELRKVVQEFPRWATPYAALAAVYAQRSSVADATRVADRLASIDSSLAPNIVQFRDAKHRDLLKPGARLHRLARMGAR